MSRHVNFIFPITGTFTVNAGSTRNLDIDLQESDNLQVMTEITFTQTASSTGLSLDLFPGFGGKDPNASIVLDGTSSATFSDNSESVTMTSFAASSGSTQIKKTAFFLNDINKKWPRWIRLKFTNNDPVNNAAVKVYGDF